MTSSSSIASSTCPAEEVAAQGGVAEAARKLGLSRIVVREVDYSRFQATDGAGDGASSDAGERSDQLWERFVDRVLRKTNLGAARRAGREAAFRSRPSGPVINDDPENASRPRTTAPSDRGRRASA